MSSQSHAATLIAAIDDLLTAVRVYRLLPRPYVGDYRELEELHRQVTRLALAAGFKPPSMATAGFQSCNPFDIKSWPANPPADWQNPNASAGVEFENALRALRTAAEGEQAPATPRGRGRQPRYDAAQDRAIADAWRRAKEAGVSKKDFAHDRQLSLKKLNLTLNRHAKRARK